MVKLCEFCSKEIIGRGEKSRYCSQKCVRIVSYLKNYPTSKSIYRNKKDSYNSDTGKGRYWEEYVAEKLNGTLMPFSHPHDVEYNGITIDVKSATGYVRPSRENGKLYSNEQRQALSKVYTFHKSECKPKKVDYLICFAFEIINNEFVKLNSWLIPYDLIKMDMTCSWNSKKYKQYEVDFADIDSIKNKLVKIK